jgi:hypothetical protein
VEEFYRFLDIESARQAAINNAASNNRRSPLDAWIES